MAGRRLLLLVVFVMPAMAQMEKGFSTDNHVRIHVVYSGGTCDTSTRIELMQGPNSIARGAPGKSCMVDLLGVPKGAYRLVVSGRGFAGIETDEISVGAFDNGPIEINIPRPQSKDDSVFRSASTSFSDLNIPKRAAKEFSKASQQMEQQQWDRAAASLEQAIALYPPYAAAYNNLGVVYAREGDRSREADALQHAIAIDSHFVPAHVNLARMDIAANNFPAAESELKNATTVDPDDGVTLVLLAYAEYMNGHFDDVIRECARVHSLNNVPHAFAHWSAAFAFEQKKQIAQAGEEFRTFVKEEPTGKRADDARKELANIANYLSAKD